MSECRKRRKASGVLTANGKLKFGFSLFDTVEEVPGLNADFFGRNLPFAELQRLRPSELKSLRALEVAESSKQASKH